MAYKVFDADSAPVTTDHAQNLSINGDTVQLPDASFVRDAHLTRDGMDLVLEGPHGTIVVEGYFAAEPAPMLMAPDGTALTPKLVDSFTTSEPQFAAANSASDVSPVGAVHEVSGSATVTHKDGTVETIVKGTPIFEGDIIQTDEAGAVNIMFIDQTTFAVSEDAKLAIDKYVFDPSTQAGTTDFSILKGVFVFTSGLIGRDDPDQVKIETPAGSIGIRDTIIAGNVDSGEITVVEGAIVLHDLGGHEVTLASQFETARFVPGGSVEHIGQLSANDVGSRFASLSGVSPSLFSNINQTQQEQGGENSDGQNAAPEGDALQGEGEQSPTPTDNHSEVAPQTPTTTTMGLASTSGFGNTSGLAPSTSSFTTPTATTTFDSSNSGPLPPPPVTTAPPPAETAVASVAPPPPTATINDPATTPVGTGTPPPIDTPPLFRSEAPAEFFTTAENRFFGYQFDKEFVNKDPGDTLTYSFGSTTTTLLSTWTTNGWISGATLNASNGHFSINILTTVANLAGPLEVIATDTAGHSISHTFGFISYDGPAAIPAGAPGIINGVSGGLYSDPSVTARSVIVGISAATSNNHIFMGDGDDSISLANSYATGNKIWMGDGLNTVTVVGSGDVDNWFFGGSQRDTFSVGNAHNRFYGMDGDDRFQLNVANTGLMANLNTPGAANIVMDGGHSNLRAASALQAEGLPTPWAHAAIGAGIGDTIELLNSGGINFTNIDDNYFKSIERIDSTDGGIQAITLNYADVLAMTDEKRVLVIKLGASDTLNFNAMGHTFTNYGTQTVDDTPGPTPTPTPGDDVAYTVYSDGTVTLLVHDAAASATVTGL